MASAHRPGKEIGSSGLNVTPMGTVDDEPSPNLRGRKAVKVFREMRDNDATIGAIFFAIENLCRQAEWEVVPYPDGVPERAEHVKSCMDDMSHS